MSDLNKLMAMAKEMQERNAAAAAADPINRPPDKTGEWGRAWILQPPADVDPVKIRYRVQQWLVEAPWAHTVWHSYVISVIRLRDKEGKLLDDFVKVHFPDATHEVMVEALDPRGPRQELIDAKMAYRLQPINFAAQFIDTDESAKKRIDDCVDEIVAGKLSPDTDFAQQWIDRFNDSMEVK